MGRVLSVRHADDIDDRKKKMGVNTDCQHRRKYQSTNALISLMSQFFRLCELCTRCAYVYYLFNYRQTSALSLLHFFGSLSPSPTK